MKTIKNNWKVALIVAVGIITIILLGVFCIQSSQNRAFTLEEMADAYICLNFPESIFDIKPEDLQKAIDVKLERERRNL